MALPRRVILPLNGTITSRIPRSKYGAILCPGIPSEPLPWKALPNCRICVYCVFMDTYGHFLQGRGAGGDS